MSAKQLLSVPKEPESESTQVRGDSPEASVELSQIEAQELEERLRYLGYIE